MKKLTRVKVELASKPRVTGVKVSLTELRSVQYHGAHDSRSPTAPQSGHALFFGDAHKCVERVFVTAALFYGQSGTRD
jgi:hypothetical protein